MTDPHSRGHRASPITGTATRRQCGTHHRHHRHRRAVVDALPTSGYERSHYEAALDLDYAVRVSELHARLFGRLKRFFTLSNLILGGAAFVTIFGNGGATAAYAGLLVAITSAFDLVYDFGATSARHQRDKEAFLRLRSRVAKMTMEDLDSELDRLKAKAASTIDALDKPAYNDNVRRHGRPECILPLSAWERFVRLFA